MGNVELVRWRGLIFITGIVAAIAVPVLLNRSLAAAHTMPPPAPTAVVVELFTSEGCSSCPPADELLAHLRREKLADGLEVIPLGLHVDYWNQLGWTDRFSSAAYSQRQARYAERFHIEGPYTPQMVVDGGTQFVGNDGARAREAILQAGQRPHQATVEISAVAADKLTIVVKAPPGASGEVMLAITEDNLKTSVRAGENGGRELHHTAVVHQLRSLGRLSHGGFERTIGVTFDKAWKLEDVRIVVFVEETGGGAIDGATVLAATSLRGTH
jgi:hypothetical protein